MAILILLFIFIPATIGVIILAIRNRAARLPLGVAIGAVALFILLFFARVTEIGTSVSTPHVTANHNEYDSIPMPNADETRIAALQAAAADQQRALQQAQEAQARSAGRSG